MTTPAAARPLPQLDVAIAAGRLMDCTSCGACCTTIGSPPFCTDDFDALPAHLKADVNAYLDGPAYAGDAERPCVWWDAATRRCRHYEHRPDVCRDFRPASLACLAHRARVGVSSGPLEAATTAAWLPAYRAGLIPD